MADVFLISHWPWSMFSNFAQALVDVSNFALALVIVFNFALIGSHDDCAIITLHYILLFMSHLLEIPPLLRGERSKVK